MRCSNSIPQAISIISLGPALYAPSCWKSRTFAVSSMWTLRASSRGVRLAWQRGPPCWHLSWWWWPLQRTSLTNIVLLVWMLRWPSVIAQPLGSRLVRWGPPSLLALWGWKSLQRERRLWLNPGFRFYWSEWTRLVSRTLHLPKDRAVRWGICITLVGFRCCAVRIWCHPVLKTIMVLARQHQLEPKWKIPKSKWRMYD